MLDYVLLKLLSSCPVCPMGLSVCSIRSRRLLICPSHCRVVESFSRPIPRDVVGAVPVRRATLTPHDSGSGVTLSYSRRWQRAGKAPLSAKRVQKARPSRAVNSHINLFSRSFPSEPRAYDRTCVPRLNANRRVPSPWSRRFENGECCLNSSLTVLDTSTGSITICEPCAVGPVSVCVSRFPPVSSNVTS